MKAQVGEAQSVVELYKTRFTDLEADMQRREERHQQTLGTLRTERDKLQERLAALQRELQQTNEKLSARPRFAMDPASVVGARGRHLKEELMRMQQEAEARSHTPGGPVAGA